MKRVIILLSLFITFFMTNNILFAQKHYPAGDRIAHRGTNRLLSIKSKPGQKLYQHAYETKDNLNIVIDGKMDEDIWKNAQVVKTFYTADRNIDDGIIVYVMNDRDNIYLFWEVENPGSLVSTITLEDSALVGNDYVQVDLIPLIPDSILYGRDYSFTICVNPEGTIWDAYFDPYDEGCYFTSWNSKAEVKTIKGANTYSIEMAVPFAEIDVYSDPGWKYDLSFHRAQGKNNVTSTSSTGITLVQTIKVRGARVLGYYWPREDFWLDVIPNLKGIEKPNAQAVRLKKQPKKNKKRDDDVWSYAEELSLSYDNKMGTILKDKTAKARIGYDNNNFYMLLEAANPYPAIVAGKDDSELGGGMGHQLKGLDGVYRDLSIETMESFWILFQPSRRHGDSPHQDWYFVTVDYTGNMTGIKYDSHGKPDKEWKPRIKADVFKLSDNWGVELTIPLKYLSIPLNAGTTWRMNVFYNIPLEEGTIVEGLSRIQAWYPTLKDEKNPNKTGTIRGIDIDYDSYIRQTFRQKTNEISGKIASLKGASKDEIKNFKKEISYIERKIKSGDLTALKERLTLLDNKIGIIEEKNLYINSLDMPNEGYSLLDVEFVNSTNGWAVGAMGTILHTLDGGRNWERQETHTDADISDVMFISENEGWAAGGRIRSAVANELMRHDERGGDGIILHTVDGGMTWEMQFAKRGAYLFGIYFVDSMNGWAVGEGGILLRTTDGGKLWSQFPTTDTIRWLNGVYFLDKMHGFIVGESEIVLETKDGGDTWMRVDAPADKKFYGFKSFYRDITFRGDKGWIVGQNGTILMTTDRGNTWTPQATEYDERIRELLDLKKVYFIDENRGYAVGGLGTVIMKTDNGGRNWSFLQVPNIDHLNGVWFGDDGTGYIVGGRSKILSTYDNGMSWITVKGNNEPVDLLMISAHGDDSPIAHGMLMTYLSRIKNRDIAVAHITRDTHSNEYKGEYYDYECNRSSYLMGARTVLHFDEFDTGNSGCRSFHINLRLWKGYKEIVRHMVAVIRTYRPEVIITHEPMYGEYDKPGHKVAGRAGFMAFDEAGEPDRYPELTFLGLKPYQPKKLYTFGSETYPPTYFYDFMGDVSLEGLNETVHQWADRSLRCFQSQGVHFVGFTPLHRVKSLVPAPKDEMSIFDGLE